MKKYFLFTLLLLLAVFTASAYDFEVDGICYNIYENRVTVMHSDYSGDIVIPETVTYDGETYTVTTINYHAFTGCTGLTSVTLPSTIASVSSDFGGCTALSRIIVDSNNSKYDSRDDCNAIILTSSNKLIAGCKNTIIPNTVTTIGTYAFDDCTSLTDITIPNSVISIDSRAFEGCDGLTNISVDIDNPKYDSRDNCNAIIETSSNQLIVGCKNTIIPNTVTTIGTYAFSNCKSLTSITIPNSVITIGSYAFRGCYGLTNVSIGNSVTRIANDAFFYCTALKEVSIPNSVTNIGDYAFASCYDLMSVTIPNSVTRFGECTFAACRSLRSVTIPNSVTNINSYMFKNCI